MIEINYYDEMYKVICDKCDYTAGYDTDMDFYKLIEYMKVDNWAIRKKKDEWEHLCPECNKK